MNTNATLKQLKEQLNSLEELLKSEHERLTTILEGIEIVENNKHILDETGKLSTMQLLTKGLHHLVTESTLCHQVVSLGYEHFVRRLVRIHLNTIEMYNEQVDIHNMQIIEYNKVRKECNRYVEIQDILDRD